MDGDDLVQGVVERLSFQGGTTECYLRIGGTIVRTVLHPSVETTSGVGAWLRIHTGRCVVYASGQGR
jgi:hypothetical protein